MYAPSSNCSIHQFREFIDYLQSVISSYVESGVVIVMRDFNAHLQGRRFLKPTDDRGKYFQDIMNYHNLIAVNTLSLCKGAASSFVSYGNCYESLIMFSHLRPA